MSPQVQLEVQHVLQLVTLIFRRNTSTDWNVTFGSLPSNLISCKSQVLRWVSQETTDTTAGPWAHWRGDWTLPLLWFSEQIRCVGWVTAWHLPAVGASLLSPFPRAKRKDLSYTDEHSSLFASAWHWTHKAWTPVHNVHNEETMVACKAAALVNTTWDTTSSRDGSLCLRTWLPHLLVSQICPCWTMQITIQMLGIQLSVRITKSTGTAWAALCYLLWSSFEGICVSAAWQLWEYTDKELGIQSAGMVWKNKTRIIYAADISCSCELAFMSEVLLMVKDSRQEFKSPRGAWSTRPTLVSLPVCKWHRNIASAVVTGTTPPHKPSMYH